jgi:hypothetical protein
VNVLVQWASLKTKKVNRLYVIKDADDSTVSSPVLEELGQADMGDYRTLLEAMRWAVRNYPAKRYFLNVWNHGNGWHFRAPPTTRDVSYDDLSGNKITTEQLGVVAAEVSREIGRPIDLVGSDSCLMAMAEVVGEMKGGISAFVGSEEVEPADGWPYEQLLRKWNAGGSKSALDVAGILTEVYLDSYPSGRGITLSGLDMGHYAHLAGTVRELATEIAGQPLDVRKRILAAVAKTRSYTNVDYKDLGDLVDQIAKEAGVGLRPETLSAVKAALGQMVAANRTSSDQSRSQGLAIWFPNTSSQFALYKDRYGALAFNRDTGWIEAIRAVLAAK